MIKDKRSGNKKPKARPHHIKGFIAKPIARWRAILSILLIGVGILVLLYPILATTLENRSQQEAVTALRQAMQKKYTPDERERAIEEAQSYNKRMKTGPILDPFLERVAPKTKVYQEYLKQLNFDGIMGSVEIPKIHVNLPIYHGTFDASLERGAGHLFGTSLPVGGVSTHTVITAHSGLGTATMFDNLPELKKGDVIYLHVAGMTLKYVVTGTQVVLPENTDSLKVVQGKDLLTLVTCTPYGINTHRLLVHAERVKIEPNELSSATKEVTYSYVKAWMIVPLVIIVVVLGTWVYFWKRNRR